MRLARMPPEPAPMTKRSYSKRAMGYFGISFRPSKRTKKGVAMFVLSVYLRIKPENVESFIAKAVDAHQQTAHFKKYIAEAVPLLASRQRHVWKRASP